MTPDLYFPIFIYTTALACIAFGAYYFSSNGYYLQEKEYRNSFVGIIICVILILWLGQRPVSPVFGDTMGYAFTYAKYDPEKYVFSFNGEWLWALLMHESYLAGLDISTFFTIIEFGYIACVFYSVKILMPRNVLLGLLFVLVSFQFFTFGVNGLRNGLACHMLLLAFALYLKGDRGLSFLIAFLALGFHRSIALPIAAFIASIYVIKDPKNAIYIWLASIPISLVSGYTFVNLLSGLGFDDRMEQYLTVSEGQALETSTSAFRWDFLLYSSMPVFITWVVVVKQQVTDKWFNILASTYCLSNAFWILVIRASFTNRFAYLSWFMYPIVIAYPIIMLPVWEDQDNKTGLILIGYALLTLGICLATGML